jgi:membrane-bound lytic murein transglycosylase D
LRAIRKYNTNDFWELARHEAGIPWETTLYVPKILATALVMNNKKAFGLDDVEPDPPEHFDVIDVAPGTPLADVANALGVEHAVMERENPMYLAGRLPPVAPGRPSPAYRVRIPAGTASKATRVFERTSARSVPVHVSRQGDTAQSVARAHGTSEDVIRALNRIGSQETLSPGTVLIVPPAEPGARQVTERFDDPVVVVRQVTPPPSTHRVFYPVVQGDTVASVAAAFKVARSDLIAWNALDSGAHLQEGMVLQVFPQKKSDLSHVRAVSDDDAKVLALGSNEFFDHFEGLNGRRRMVVKAKKGDTLAAIGRRYQHSVGWMERINRRSRSDRLAPGEEVVVYVDRGRYPPPKPPEPRASATAGSAPVSVSLAAPSRAPARAGARSESGEPKTGVE